MMSQQPDELRAGLFTSAARCPVALLQDLESQQQQ